MNTPTKGLSEKPRVKSTSLRSGTRKSKRLVRKTAGRMEGIRREIKQKI